jgi:hypothetical protein
MSAINGWLCGAICGAGTMYFFDPLLGRRRRALMRDQLDHLAHRLPEDFDAAWRDLTNRAYGTVAERGSCMTAHDNSDEVVRQRVRTKAGRFVTHPSSLKVDVTDGCVTLKGPVLASEVQPLIQAVRWVRGVCSIDNQLDVHESAGDVSALQGAGQLQGEPFELLQENWTPGIRLAAGTLGGALLANCLLNRTATSLLGGFVGFALLARSMAQPQAAGQSFRTKSQHAPSGRSALASASHKAHWQTSDLGPNAPVHGPPWPPSITQPQHPAAEEADRFPPVM